MPSTQSGPDGLLTDRAYAAIKEAIIRCELVPGEFVAETGLMSQFEVGRAPVRAALIRLAHEGLLEPIARRGHRTASITLKQVEDTFELRILLEAHGARLAAGRIDVGRLRKLDEECEAGCDRGDAADVARYLSVNNQIHAAITAASGNERLATLHQQLLDDMERILHYALRLGGDQLEIRHDHRVMIAALAGSDGESAASVAARQVRDSEAVVLSALRGQAPS